MRYLDMLFQWSYTCLKLQASICSGLVIISSFITSNAFAALTCSHPKPECIEDGGIRYFDEIEVKLDCWRYKVVYKCEEKSDNNCQQLRDQGCYQIGAKCKTFAAGTCVVQDETYKCPVEKCEEAGDIPCAKKKPFCVGGDCAPAVSAKNNNFNKAASSLAVLAAAAQEIEKQNTEKPVIFVGRSMECSTNILPGLTKDCCAGDEGILGSCDAEEKELLQIRRNGRAIEVGEYCYNEVLGKCTSYHRAFCVFDSKIARIVQNDGRKNQLGISLGHAGGDSAHLDCRGITPEELSRMDFSKMDFSPLYAEIRQRAEKNMPSTEILSNKVTSSDLDDLRKRSSKGVPGSELQIEKKVSHRLRDFYDRTKKTKK